MIVAILIGSLTLSSWGSIKRDAAPVPQPKPPVSQVDDVNLKG